MKIYSPFIDYYDFLQGLGSDEKVIYYRVQDVYNSNNAKPDFTTLGKWELYYKKCGRKNPIDHFVFAICNVIYKVYQYNGHFYFGEEILSIPEEHRKGFNEKDLNLHLTKTDFNSVIKCPVAIILSLENYTWYLKNPKLSDYKIGSIITPINMWNSICNFLTAEPVIIDSRTDIQKLKSHGFDEKTSFRKM